MSSHSSYVILVIVFIIYRIHQKDAEISAPGAYHPTAGLRLSYGALIAGFEDLVQLPHSIDPDSNDDTKHGANRRDSSLN